VFQTSGIGVIRALEKKKKKRRQRNIVQLLTQINIITKKKKKKPKWPLIRQVRICLELYLTNKVFKSKKDFWQKFNLVFAKSVLAIFRIGLILHLRNRAFKGMYRSKSACKDLKNLKTAKKHF
jgi:hypothetical protein